MRAGTTTTTPDGLLVPAMPTWAGEPPYGTREDDDEAAVDDLLVAQHYAFEDESDASGEIPAEGGNEDEE